MQSSEIQDRAAGAIMGAFMGDALALGRIGIMTWLSCVEIMVTG